MIRSLHRRLASEPERRELPRRPRDDPRRPARRARGGRAVAVAPPQWPPRRGGRGAGGAGPSRWRRAAVAAPVAVDAAPEWPPRRSRRWARSADRSDASALAAVAIGASRSLAHAGASAPRDGQRRRRASPASRASQRPRDRLRPALVALVACVGASRRHVVARCATPAFPGTPASSASPRPPRRRQRVRARDDAEPAAPRRRRHLPSARAIEAPECAEIDRLPLLRPDRLGCSWPTVRSTRRARWTARDRRSSTRAAPTPRRRRRARAALRPVPAIRPPSGAGDARLTGRAEPASQLRDARPPRATARRLAAFTEPAPRVIGSTALAPRAAARALEAGLRTGPAPRASTRSRRRGRSRQAVLERALDGSRRAR